MKAKYSSQKPHNHHDSSNHIHEHDHGDGHIHTHEHHHDHPHNHEHDLEGISKEEKTLRILLAHWVDHNNSHQDGFKEWVDKANEKQKHETATYIQKAIEFMDKANEMLLEAKKSL